MSNEFAPDDDVQAVGDDFRERAKTDDSFADYGYPIPYPPRPEDLA